MPQHIQGWVEQGNVQVVGGGGAGSGGTFPVTSVEVQQSFPLATVTVYIGGTTNLATITDDAGLVKPNPFIADARGYWSFNAVPGTYDIHFSGGGIPTPYTLTGFLIPGTGTGGAGRISDLLGPAVVSVCDFPGATADAKIKAAAAALPPSGGTLDTRCLTGAQTFGTDPFIGMTGTPITVILGPAIFTSSVSLTVPANVNLTMLEGALISMLSGTTVTIQGSLEGSSISQHFLGHVSILSNAIPVVYPQWWGATGIASVDSTAAVQAALQAGVSGYPVYVPQGAYKVTASLVVGSS